MFVTDQSPSRVTATPAATRQLSALAAERGALTVLLSDDQARLLPADQVLPHGALRLGQIAEVTVAADAGSHTQWWRNRTQIDLRGADSESGLTFRLAPLDEAELYEAVAAGPLPRY